MKYISNSFSPKMIYNTSINQPVNITFETIDKNTFLKATKEAYSIIGHKELADKTGLKYNRESISLKSGDEIYLILLEKIRLSTPYGPFKNNEKQVYMKGIVQ